MEQTGAKMRLIIRLSLMLGCLLDLLQDRDVQ